MSGSTATLNTIYKTIQFLLTYFLHKFTQIQSEKKRENNFNGRSIFQGNSKQEHNWHNCTCHYNSCISSLSFVYVTQNHETGSIKRFINTGSTRHWIIAPHLNCQIIRLFIITFCRMDQLAIKLYSLQPITSGLVIYKPIVTLIIVVPLKAYPEVHLNGEKRLSR